jgi:hypothetical protein
MLNGKSAKSLALPVLLLIWSAVVLFFIFVKQNKSFLQINGYVAIASAFYAGLTTMLYAIRKHEMGFVLYNALGLSCLQLGSLYSMVLGALSKQTQRVSIADFCTVCAYLFIISAIIDLKTRISDKFKIPFPAVNLFAALAVASAGYAVILNDSHFMLASYSLLDVILVVMVSTLMLRKDTRFFALMIVLISVIDIFMMMDKTDTFNLVLFSMLPILYVMLGLSITTLKAGEQLEKRAAAEVI